MKGLLITTFFYTTLFEAIGAVVLTYCYLNHYDYALPRAIYHGVFHAVMAFGNAGFALYANSLTNFAGDPLYMLTISILIIMGGLGFLVLFNVSTVRFWSNDLVTRGRLSLHSRSVLYTTGFLIIAGWIMFIVLERDNTLSGMGWLDKAVASFFHSVTPRTAGFNVVNMAEVTPLSFFGTMFLMFIGGSPASTAGGIKTTTALVLILTVVAMLRGKTRTQIRHRTIPDDVIREAIVIATLSIIMITSFFCILLVSETISYPLTFVSIPDALLFEAVSAFGTVGLSTGITPLLSPIGKMCIIALMFLGRVGPVTLTLVVARRQTGDALHYPEEDVIVG